MPAELINIDPMQFGLVGFVLILMWKVLDVGVKLTLAKRGTVTTSSTTTATPAICQMDRQLLKDIHTHTVGVQKQIDQGHFSCQWKSRDEIRDLLDAIKDQTRAMIALSEELRKTRNGNGANH